MKKIIFIIVLIFISFGIAAGYHFYKIFYEKNTSFDQEYVHLIIPTNSTKDQLLDSISNYVEDLSKFIKAANHKDYFSNFKSGRFKIEKDFNNNEIINSIRSKNIPINITFNNIQTLNQLMGEIASKIEADSTSLLNAFNDKSFLNNLKLNEDSVFSLFIPNTYQFFWNTNAIQFRDRIVNEFDIFWNENRLENSKKIDLNPHEVITLASIVQMETPKVDERPTVAGVYLNRLEKRMKLQADPTIIYTIKKRDGFDTKIRRVLYKDLRIKSPYNTYLNRGLPPGPIITPDISAIEAVLNPREHSFLYFVADVENPGYHMFSRTNAEHNRKKRQYTDWLRKKNIRR